MKIIKIEDKYALEYLRDTLNDYKMKYTEVIKADYHHNSRYSDVPSICEYGILTLRDLKKYGIKDYSDELLEKLEDTESHVNGTRAISLSKVGLRDIRPDREEYDPFDPNLVDFLITNEVRAGRSSYHYENEYLALRSIDRDELRALDVRLLELAEKIEKSKASSINIKSIVDKFNHLKNIALAMKIYDLDMPLREMSFNQGFNIDVDKIANMPRLILEKEKNSRFV